MPLEIKELHIRVAIEAKPPQHAESTHAPPQSQGGTDRDSIIAECVEQVMHIMQVRKER
jgi:Family of unknown function (DUF5908)